MTKTIITGATSMIGVATINECVKNNVFVYAVVRPNSINLFRLPKSNLIKVIECDLNSLEKLPNLIKEKCDIFYHIGWGHTGAKRNDNLTFQVDNINYILTAIESAKALGCTRFVGAGSQAEYGISKDKIISPDSSVDPTTPYGICKFAAHKLAMVKCNTIGIECIWTRIFSVYGIYNKETSLIMNCIKSMLNNKEVNLTLGQQNWDYLFSSDAGLAMFLAGFKGKNNSVYCIGNGSTKTIREYVEIIKTETKSNSKINYGAILYTASTVMNLCADISSLTLDTGFIPNVTFQEGIKKTIAWYRDFLNMGEFK